MKCSVCKSVSDTYDPYLDVALEIRVRQWGGTSSALGGAAGQPSRSLSSALSLQQAANIVRALELFVKSDVLSGENAYMCAR